MENPREIPDFEFVDRMVSLLDTKYRLPGTKFRFGLDPILGLIPWVGDATTFFIQSILAAYMLKYGASGKVAIKMFLNVLIDTILGSIPIIGQIGDFFYKANVKNVKLLKEHYKDGKHQGSGKGIIIVLLLLMVLFVILIGFLMYKLLAWLYQAISNGWS